MPQTQPVPGSKFAAALADNGATSAPDYASVLRAWLAALNQLVGEVESVVAPAQASGLVTEVRRDEIEREEEHLGSYRAPQLRMTLARGGEVLLSPAYRFTVGAQGRADLVCGARRIMLLHLDGEWHRFEFDMRGRRTVPLSRAALDDALASLVA